MLKDDAPGIWHQGFLKIDSGSDADSWKIGLREDRDDAIELEKMEGMYVQDLTSCSKSLRDITCLRSL